MLAAPPPGRGRHPRQGPRSPTSASAAPQVADRHARLRQGRRRADRHARSRPRPSCTRSPSPTSSARSRSRCCSPPRSCASRASAGPVTDVALQLKAEVRRPDGRSSTRRSTSTTTSTRACARRCRRSTCRRSRGCSSSTRDGRVDRAARGLVRPRGLRAGGQDRALTARDGRRPRGAPPRRCRAAAARGARARPALEPADPGVAVRLGGGDRARRLLRRARGAVAEAAARGRDGWRPLPGGSARCSAPGRSRSLCGAIGVGAARARGRRRATPAAGRALDNFAPTFVFIIFWVGLVFASAAARRRLPRRSTRGARSAACCRARRGAARLPGAARALAGRARPAGLHLDRAGLGLGRVPRAASRRRARLHRADAGRDGRLRRREVGRARRGVRRLLQPVLAASSPFETRDGVRRRAPARWRAAAAGPAAGDRRRCVVGDDRHRHLRRAHAGPAVARTLAIRLNDVFDGARGRRSTTAPTLVDTVGLLAASLLIARLLLARDRGRALRRRRLRRRRACAARSCTRSCRSRSSTSRRTT